MKDTLYFPIFVVYRAIRLLLAVLQIKKMNLHETPSLPFLLLDAANRNAFGYEKLRSGAYNSPQALFKRLLLMVLF